MKLEDLTRNLRTRISLSLFKQVAREVSCAVSRPIGIPIKHEQPTPQKTSVEKLGKEENPPKRGASKSENRKKKRNKEKEKRKPLVSAGFTKSMKNEGKSNSRGVPNSADRVGLFCVLTSVKRKSEFSPYVLFCYSNFLTHSGYGIVDYTGVFRFI